MLSRQLRIGTLLTATVALALAAPAAAQEEAETVPPDNSAATQYTEPFPTAGGNRDAYDHDRRRTPREVLGPNKARALERRGPAGEEVAELVAETAPSGASYTDSGSADTGAGSDVAGREAPSVRDADVAPSSDRSTSERESAGGATSGDPGAQGRGAIPAVDGSSGVGSALSAAVGSSGGSGALLPIILLVTLAWAVLYVTTRKRPTAE